MCEQTPIDYKDGDVVWVKLGPCWWPGEVRELNKLPPEWIADFRKRPITAVKFFDEDSYEYVRSIDKIYSYNCTKKNEFIKKGLDLYRAKNTFMDKFPADVSTAEKLTDGDPNIIESSLFSPEKKTNFAALLFGATKPKKSPRKPVGSGKRPFSGSSNTYSPSGSSKGTSNKSITHPRFLGHDDHEVRILVQSPEKPVVEDQEREPTYNCTSCGFTTSRIDVIVLHNKSHIQGVYNTPTSTVKKGKKPPMKKGKKVLKMTRSKTSSIVEDLALIEKGLFATTESSDEEIAEEWDDEPKRKRKKNKRKPKPVPIQKEEGIKIDIRDNLLAEWGDDSEEAEEDVNLNTSSTVESDTSTNKVEQLTKIDNKIDDSKRDADKSCFDFEEEEDNEIIGTSVGRKIPRVIPHADRQKTLDPDLSEANLPTAEDDINRNEQIKEVVKDVSDVVRDDLDAAKDDLDAPKADLDAAKDDLDAAKDDLDVADDGIDTAQNNLDVSKNIVAVVKDDSNLTKDELNVSQDNLNLYKDILNNEDDSKKGVDNEKDQDPDVNAFKDILDATVVPDLPEIPHALKFEQNFHNARTIKFPDKTIPDLTEDKVVALKPGIKEAPETVAKLINPKKRFVKSFEDFEQQWNHDHKKSVSPEDLLHKDSKLLKPEEQSNSTQDQVPILEHELNTEESKSIEHEQFTNDVGTLESETILRNEAKLMETEQEAEKSTSVVEVSKLKTQIKSKLESADKLQQTTSIRSDTCRSPRIREKTSEKQKEDKLDESWLTKKTTKRHRFESLSPKSKFMESARPKSPDELKTFEITKIQKNEDPTMELDASELNKPVEKSVDKLAELEDKISENEIKPIKKFTKSRRWSIKMPEVEETHEMEQTAEFLELEQSTLVKVEPVKVLEIQQNTEVPELKQVVANTPKIESQIVNESHKQLCSESNEYLETTNNENELNKEQCNSPQLESVHNYNFDSSTCENNQENIVEERQLSSVPETFVTDCENNQENIVEERQLSSVPETFVTDCENNQENIVEERQLSSVPETFVTDMYTESELHTEELSINTNTDILEIPRSHMTPKKGLSNELDEYICSQLHSVSAELELEKNIESEITDIQTCDIVPREKEEYSSFRIENTDSEDLSALSTLAAVSELTTNLDIQSSSHHEKSKIIEGNLLSIADDAPCIEKNNSEKSKLIDSNLTFVTEDDLADAQVEIADTSSADTSKVKPITLSSFSVDFTDPSHVVNKHISLPNEMSNVTVETQIVANIPHKLNKRKHTIDIDQSEMIEKSLERVFQEEPNFNTSPNVHNSKKLTPVLTKDESTNLLSLQDSNFDIEEQIPSLVVCSSKQSEVKSTVPKTNYLDKSVDHAEYTSSSKLLEILTDAKPKSTKTESISSQKSSNTFGVPSQPGRKIDSKLPAILTKEVKNISKFDPKNSKFVIKSTIPSKTNVMPISSKFNKPIILSEKIIKPVSESESVSVQKVTSKRSSNQDIEDIDTFIIQKPAKKMMISKELDINESVPVLSQPIKKPTISRGKAKILQQTIIKPAGEMIQPTTSLPVTSTFTEVTTTSQTPIDDNMFDINSMPIVLGDQILTAESIENLPVVLSDSVQPTKNVASKSQNEQIKLLNKTTAVTTQSMFVKTYSSQKMVKSPRTIPTSTTKVVKSSPAIITRTGKSDKFIIVPSGSSTPTGSKYTVGKRPPVMKRSSPVILPTPTPAAKVQTTTASSEPTGNKIMIVTNQQGRQSRVLLTPAQQKLLGYQATGSKSVKNTLKGNILQKASNIKSTGSLATVASPKVSSTMISRAIVNSKGEIISTSNQNLITSDGQVLMPVKSQQIRGLKTETPKGGRKIQMQSQKILLQDGLNALKGSTIPGQQKTIVIKNQQGQIVKKFQGTDDALLEQQVAEQVQAIKASGSFSSMKARQEVSTSKIKPAIRRSYPKKTLAVETARSTNKTQMVLNTSIGFMPSKIQKSEASVPPLAPISPKRSDTLLLSQSIPKVNETKVVALSTQKDVVKPEQVQQKPLNQLIIQDALGNQTTITEGQILALPSGETIDGQPQSYMLVTLDEAGNLAPLNNEALLSLDPNLCLGGDLSNMVLQIDEGTVTAKQDSTLKTKAAETSIKEVSATQNSETVRKETTTPNIAIPAATSDQLTDNSVTQETVQVTNDTGGLGTSAESVDTSQPNLETVQTVTCSIGSDPNQQLIITGDPISAQKFIESLAEGNPDLANLLASAEGNILIQTDEQQILINTDAENQVLMPVTEGMDVIETSESDGNPMFATQPTKNQDILAAALADTDVFQQEHTASPALPKLSQSQLSPNSGLYPSGVSNVLGTTLSLSSPIMTPLEVPSSNSKKIPDEESDILTTEVPKNVDLPITITDPNISQTVSQQQVASLMASELTSGLDLPLTITDQGVPLTSTEMNSPSFVYSLPSLDESVDMHPKTFSGPISMPLLTEEPQDTTNTDTNVSDIESKSEIREDGTVEKESPTNFSEVDIETTVCDSNLHTSSADQVPTLFETSELATTDSLKDNENIQSSSRTFLGTTIETEEGLCTLGGAMCSSLSEPPPDMFDLSVVNSNYGAEEIKEHTVDNIPEDSIAADASENITLSCQEKPLDCNLDVHLAVNEQTTSIEDYDKYENYDNESRNDSTPLSNLPLNSESSSPAVNIDENSCEIPVQPQIVTDLSSSSFETHEVTDSPDFESHKRISADDDIIENEKKKIKFD